jgi:NAD(P)-dependent dehydrogenase (short-subunit alcohol dehydrogenase family)
MQGKTVVMTGATSGIGEVAALTLAREGARIVFVARDRVRGEAMLAALRATAPDRNHVLHLADLSRLADMRRVAAEIAAAEPQIHVLLNNAGALFHTRQLTVDGLERSFALNHLSYFVITNLLLQRLRATPGARIVSTSSRAHRGARLDFDDLQSQRHYRAFGAYARSKLMNILFTRELAERLTRTGVTANCHHPGFVATRFGEADGTGLPAALLRLAKHFALTSEQGAQTMIYLASSPQVEGISGRYFHRCRPAPISRAAQSDEDARRLWDLSTALAGLSGPAAGAVSGTGAGPGSGSGT